MRDGGAKACSNRTSKFTAQTSRFRSAEINKIRDRMNSKGREKQRENGPPNLSHLLARPVHNYPPFFRQYLLETIPPPLEARPSHSNENFALVTGLKKGPAA